MKESKKHIKKGGSKKSHKFLPKTKSVYQVTPCKIQKPNKKKSFRYVGKVQEDNIASLLEDERNRLVLSVNDDDLGTKHSESNTEIISQSGEKQFHWFFSCFQEASNTKLSSLELQEIPENVMIQLPQSLDHSVENLSEHVKDVFGVTWNEELCKRKLGENVFPGSPVLLVICASAMRCMEILRGFKELTMTCHAAKLFAKHLKIDKQVDVLKGRVNIAVGTPSRIKKLIEIDSLKMSRLSVLMLDIHKDAKGYTLFSLPQIKNDFWELYKTHFHEQVMKWKLRICLY